MANRSPPTPLLMGSMSPSAAFAAMAASTAVPPRLRMSSATWLVSGWLVAAMPCVAMTSDRVGTSEPLGRGPANDPSMTMRPRIARRPRTMRGSGRLLGARETRIEDLSYFAIGHALLVFALGVVSHDAAPERDGDGIAKVFGDFPAAREAVEDELDGELADAAATVGPADEELGHAVVDGWAARHRAACHHGEAHGLGAAQDHQRVHGRIAKPARELVGFAVADLAQRSRAEHAGVQRRKIIQVIAV